MDFIKKEILSELAENASSPVNGSAKLVRLARFLRSA